MKHKRKSELLIEYMKEKFNLKVQECGTKEFCHAVSDIVLKLQN